MRRDLYAFFLCIALGLLLPVSLRAQLQANFTSNIVTGCSPILVQFTDQSTGGATSWLWNLGNNTTSTLQNPSTTYINPGTYTVTLTVSNGSTTNTKTLVNYITVVPSPVVSFIASDTVGACSPTTIQFTNQSNLNTAGPATYLWDFGDGFTSNAQNPIHTYTSSGNYSVTLSVTNAAGCSKILTKTNYIHIVNKPVADFNAPITGSCSVPLIVNFNNTSSGATSYWWDFGNGNNSTATNPSATYTAVGAYNVTLVASLGNCSDTIVKPAYISIGNLTASFTQSTSSICTGNQVTFTNTSLPGPGNSTWYFGDGGSSISANASHAYSTPGTYTVTLIVNYNNCADTATSTVTVNQGPTVQFTANSTLSCTTPFTVQFNNTTTGAVSYSWNFGDGGTSTAQNPSHTYTSFGNYTVTLTATAANGCTKTLSIPAYISVYQASMTITANPPSGCAPAPISFSTSVSPNVPVTNYTWNFGDGNTVIAGATTTHTYLNPGTYTVTVNYTVAQGCNYTSAPITVNIGQPPVAGFTGTPTNICPQGTVNFTNTSTGPSGTTYTWYFGDGGTSTQTNPSHSYNSQGTYTVTLIANNNGCMDTFVIPNMVVVNPPIADFNVVYSCANRLHVDFQDGSQGASSWFWEFGDGQTSTLQNPSHTYASYGTYLVRLTVTHQPSGCISIRELNMILYDMDADFVADDTTVCKGQPVHFTGTIVPGAAPYFINTDWYFGDGGTTLNTGLTATHTYTTSGVYTVMFVVKDQRGCKDTFIKQNYITVGGPTANFSGAPTSGCAPLLVNFTDQSNSGGTGIFARIWRFGDGSISTANVGNIAHTYVNNGTYSVTLVITDGLGCKDSLVRPNYITASKPAASFSSADTLICPGNTVHFTNSTAGTNMSYQWDFGDGGTATTTSPTHVYGTPGYYTVRLIATNAGGCKDTLIMTNYIHVQGMNLSFTASDTFATCPPLTVTFTNTSTGVGSYTWIFGNGNTSSTASPTTIYTVPGVYTVKLIGHNGSGCIDTVYKTITVLGPTGTLSYSPINGCLPLTVQFTSTNTNTQSLIWDMDNGFTQTTTASTYTYTYTQAGMYIPRLLLSDGISCIVPIFGTDTIRVDKVDADFTFTPGNICQAGTISFTDTTLFAVNPITTRNWTFGDGGTSTIHNPSHTYNAPGSYTVTLIIGTSMGCKDTIVKTVTILPAPTVSGGPNQSLCQGQTLSAQLQASGAATYTWSPAGGLSCVNCSNPVASPSVTTTYTVIGTAANGCKDTSNVTVVVHPLPNVTTGASTNICSGASIQLAATGAQSYAWTPSTGLSCTNCQSPIASPSGTTTYTVTGTDAFGCTDTAQTTVTITPLPTVTATGSATICAGGNSQLQASGASSYSWTPSTGLSCTSCANPVATPATTTTYIVSGTNGIGCSDTAQVTIVVNPLPAIVAPPQSMCLGIPAQLQASGAASYSWTPSTGLSCTNCSNPTANISSTTTYTVTGTTALGCASTAQVTVTVNTPPTITVSNNQTICAGSPVPLQVSGAQTYAWSPSSGLSCSNCSNPNASPGATTTYTVIGTDANGCKDTGSVTVTVNPLPNVNAGADQSVCRLNTAQLNVTGASAYTWSPANTLSCNNCNNPVATPLTTTTYTVTGTDANGCSNTDNVTVNIYPQPQINAGPDQTICHGASVQLLASGGASYIWSPATALSCTACPDPVASPVNNITYTVVGTDANGCHDSDKVSITVTQMQPINIGAGDTLCRGESAQLSVSGGDSYVWLPPTGLNNSTINDPVATPDVTTTYTVIIQQGNCFSDTGYVTVVVNPVPTVNAGADQTIYAGSSVNLFANTTYTTKYLWTPADYLSCTTCQAPVATPDRTTTYTVYVSNQYGCESKDDVTIFVKCDNSLVFMANTFTPNGDGANDRFYPQGKGITKINRFRIFNRWGEVVYDVQNITPNDEMAGWDGTYRGEQLKPDVYVYMVDATCVTGEPIQVKGDISLIR